MKLKNEQYMKKLTKINSVKELLQLVDAGKKNFIVKVAPGINYTKTILKEKEDRYLVTSFCKGSIVTRKELEDKTELVLGQISKGRLWVAQ